MKRSFLFVVIIALMSLNSLLAQDSKPYVRIANIIVDSAQLEGYKAAVKEHAEAAVAKEPGVITLYAVYDKDKPTHVTVFEIYADKEAYQTHIQTAHFKKYKSTVANMVTSLTLTDVVPIALQRKP